jgi:hypothetical protein
MKEIAAILETHIYCTVDLPFKVSLFEVFPHVILNSSDSNGKFFLFKLSLN